MQSWRVRKKNTESFKDTITTVIRLSSPATRAVLHDEYNALVAQKGYIQRLVVVKSWWSLRNWLAAGRVAGQGAGGRVAG